MILFWQLLNTASIRGPWHLDFDGFLKLVTKRAVTLKQEKRLHNLWRLAHDSAGCEVHEAAKWEAQTLVAKLRSVRDHVKDLERRMEKVASQFPEYQCLLSIPGFGPIVSAMVLAAIGNPFRFEHRKQVLRMAGLDLSAERSGKNSDSAKAVISKQGKAALRYALVQAAMVASTSNPKIRNYFSGLLKGREFERGIRLKMRVKLAAKFLVVAWTLMKSNEQFEPSCFMA
jgi:transposase